MLNCRDQRPVIPGTAHNGLHIDRHSALPDKNANKHSKPHRSVPAPFKICLKRRHMWQYQRSIRGTAFRFAIVGAINTMVDAAVFFFMLTATNISPVWANVLSYSTGMISSFILNRSWTFRVATDAPWKIQLFKFVGVNILTLTLSTLVVWSLSIYINPLSAKAVSILVTFIFGFLLNRNIVF
jgi:putative flippase GtrA